MLSNCSEIRRAFPNGEHATVAGSMCCGSVVAYQRFMGLLLGSSAVRRCCV